MAPALAKRFRIICLDLKGYGQSDAPAGDDAHKAYSKREMGHEVSEFMHKLGHPRFSVVGHDRGALVGYLDLTQRGNLPLLRPPVREGASEAMAIDPATRRNLELTFALGGGREGSLLAAMTVRGSAAISTRRKPLSRARGKRRDCQLLASA